MGRISERDRRAVDELADALAVRPSPPVLGQLVEPLRQLLDADRVVAYAAKHTLDGYALDFAHWAGFRNAPATLTRRIAAGFARARAAWALFDPTRPERQQRNRVVALPPPRELGSVHARLRRLGVSGADVARAVERMQRLEARVLGEIELAGLNVCRVLVCDGPRLLAFVGAFRHDRFAAREQALLGRLVPSLRRRLAFERLHAFGDAGGGSLDGLLEALPAATFIVAADGTVEHANTAGLELLRRDRAAADELGKAVRGRPSPRFSVRRLAERGRSPYWVVREMAPPCDEAARLALAARGWKLTSREREVLVHVVRGAANKEIAARLACQGRTVEHHVTQLLMRSGTPSRSALIAAFWRLS
jgi:DNA-binding CsgD family transcriptional regulator